MAEWKTAGKVRMTPKGEYDSTEAYEVLDMVLNDTGTKFYVAKQAVPAGTALTNTEYWTVVSDVQGAVDAAETAAQEVSRFEQNLSGIKSKSGRLVYIDDALDGLEPVSVSSGGAIYGKNFGMLNAISYTGYGVTFTVDANDPNTVTISGTANGANAYTDGSITTQTARINVPAGTYCMRVFSDDLNDQTINFYVNDVTASRVLYIGPANTPTTLTFNQETQLGVRFQVPINNTVDATLHFYFGVVETEEYEPYYAASETMHGHSTVFFESAAGEIEYYAHIKNHREEIITSNSAEIFDAVNGVEAVSLPTSAMIYSRNMFRANLGNRTTNNVTFQQDTADINTVHVSGTATADAYSYGSVFLTDTHGVITTINGVLLPAGTYYIAHYSDSYTDSLDKLYWLYLNTIPVSTNTNSGTLLRDRCHKLVLAEPTWIAVRVMVPSGTTIDEYIHVYISKYLPLPEYVQYAVPNRYMKRYSIVEGLNNGAVGYYKRSGEVRPIDVKISTFNVGDFSGGGSRENYETPPTMMDAYMAYIGSLNTDVLCTQEDRLVYNPSVQPPVKVYDVFYKYLFAHSETESYATSISTHPSLKRISSNLGLSPSGRYTFNAQGVEKDDQGNVNGNSWSSFTYSGLLVGGRFILLIDVHLAPHYYNYEVRADQITELLDFIGESRAENIIICGDLNNWDEVEEDGQVVELHELDPIVNAGYTLANNGIFGKILTFYSGNHAFDNICIKSNYIKMRNVQAVQNSLNDHYALTATISVI